MKKIGLVLSAIFLSGCASTDNQDRPEDRYFLSLTSVESSELFFSSTLPEDLGYGEAILATAFSSYVAELDNTLGVVMLEVKPVYGDTSMELSLEFGYCNGVVIHNGFTSCGNTIDTHKEVLSFNYNYLPSEVVLANGIQLEVGMFE